LAPANLFVVTTTADAGAGSLRAAIIANNDPNNQDGTQNTITFKIPIVGGSYPFISLNTSLDPITYSVFIDGTSEPNGGLEPIPKPVLPVVEKV
jgi:hypothetical protein